MRPTKERLDYLRGLNLGGYPIHSTSLPELFSEIEALTTELTQAHKDLFAARHGNQDLKEQLSACEKERDEAEYDAKLYNRERRVWEKIANEWREDYDKLKNKYEPLIAVLHGCQPRCNVCIAEDEKQEIK